MGNLLDKCFKVVAIIFMVLFSIVAVKILATGTVGRYRTIGTSFRIFDTSTGRFYTAERGNKGIHWEKQLPSVGD